MKNLATQHSTGVLGDRDDAKISGALFALSPGNPALPRRQLHIFVKLIHWRLDANLRHAQSLPAGQRAGDPGRVARGAFQHGQAHAGALDDDIAQDRWDRLVFADFDDSVVRLEFALTTSKTTMTPGARVASPGAFWQVIRASG